MVVVAGSTSQCTADAILPGTGTEADPYQIGTAEDLIAHPRAK